MPSCKESLLPLSNQDPAMKALIFDSHFDPYKGVMIYIRMITGSLEKKNLVQLMATNRQFEITEVGIFSPFEKPVAKLQAGEVGVFHRQYQRK